MDHVAEHGEPWVEPVSFFSDGLALVGDLYLPPRETTEPVPALVLCTAMAGVKYHRAASFARVFNTRGLAFLSFEYRGWGGSEGDRTRLFPQEHTTDARSAVAYLRQRPEIDPGRISILGQSIGGMVGLQAAIEDPDLRSVVCMYALGDGNRWLRSLRRPWEWREFLDRLEGDRRCRVLTGVSELVAPHDIVLDDPLRANRHAGNAARSDEYAAWKLTLASADAIMAFRPEDAVHRIAPRPILCIACRDDTTQTLAEAEALYARIPGPKRLVVLPIDHYQLYEPAVLEPLLDDIATFVLTADRTD